MSRILLLALLSPLVAPLGACHAAGTQVTNVIGIDVAEGVNDVHRFAPDGRQGLIIVARQSGPLSAPVYLVLLPRLTPVRGWDVVGVSDGAGRVDTAPRQAGTRAGSVRFARGKVGGLPATLMFIATAGRQAGRVDIVTYRLVTDGDDGSGLSAVFDPIRTISPARAFCSAGEALVEMEGLDPTAGDGCPGA